MIKHVWPLPETRYMPLASIEEKRPVALFYTRAAYEAVKDRLHLKAESEFDVTEATVDYWKSLVPLTRGEVVYAVGGGLAVDAAKFVAAELALDLICLPTVISVDAFLTWASGFREDGCVRYVATKPPDQVIVDLDVIATGPESIRAAGICDVLSIATGSWDWRYADEKKINPAGMEYSAWVDAAAKAIMDGAIECAEAAGKGDPDGLKQMIDCLALEVQLCNQIGHSRPEEGSEHYYAYAVENVMGKGLPHGDLVGPGILTLAELQGQPIARLRRALEDCCIPLDRIPADAHAQTLRQLPAYCRKHNLPHGIAHDLNEKLLAKVL